MISSIRRRAASVRIEQSTVLPAGGSEFVSVPNPASFQRPIAPGKNKQEHTRAGATMISANETITLRWSMDDESWSHWAKGRGKQTVKGIVLEALKEVRKKPQARKRIKDRCASIREDRESPNLAPEPTEPKHKVDIQLPAAIWGEACRCVGREMIPGNPVKPGELLAAVIIESSSWQQIGNETDELLSGWLQNSLISSLNVSTELTHKGLRLGIHEKIIAWIVAISAFASAVAA